MNISGIRTYAGFYDYNEIKNNEVRSQQIQQAKSAGEEDRALQTTQLEDGANQQTFDAYDYAQQYQPDATYEMKGAESDLSLLDVEQVLSDVQKDQVLQQYQFFIGESKAQASGETDLVARTNENFYL